MKPIDPRLLRHARAARGYLALAVALGVVAAGLVVVQAFAVVAGVVRGVSLAGSGAAVWPQVRAPLLVLVAAVLARAGVAWAAEVAAHRAAADVTSELRTLGLGSALRLGPGWLGGQRSGELATLLTRGVDAIEGYFSRYLPALVTAAVVPVLVVVALVSQDLLSGVVVAVTLPLIPLFAALVGLATAEYSRGQWRATATLGGHFLDVIRGLPTLVAYRRARAQSETLAQVGETQRVATMRTLRLAFLSGAVLELIATLSVALLAVSVGLRLVNGHLDLSTGLLVLVLAPEAYWPLRQVGALFHASTEGLAAMDEVFGLAEGAAAATPPGTRRAVPDLRQSLIRFEEAEVCYDRQRPALECLNLEITPGEHVGIVGPSGSGKSTLLSLLLGLVTPTEGRVVVDGPDGVQDLRELEPAAWRRLIAVVPQHPWLAPVTVLENLRLGCPEATEDQVRQALLAAGAAAMVEELPDGLGTVLGEGGAGLSAGQRQRLAVARAFLLAVVRDTPLVLLDEPTAHLDAESERAVAAAVRRLSVGRTVVTVAHRPALLTDVDRVVDLRVAPAALAEVGV